jgi:LysM repeat protein
MKNLPWILLGVGALGAGGYLVFRNRKAALPALPGATTLPAAVQNKVASQIAASQDPKLLVQLAAGLQKTGATQEAMKALEKAAAITGQPASVPGTASMPPITIQPGAAPLPPLVPATPSGNTGIAPPSVGALSSYKVVSGDIPGAIAKRFKLSLSQLANAQGPANSKRIMAGQIKVGETLKLPPNSLDTGPANHAKGVAA